MATVSLAAAAPALPRAVAVASSGRHRWWWRIAFAALLAVLAVHTSRQGYVGAGNRALLDQAGRIRWGSGDLSFVADVFPPVPTAVASVVPGLLAAAVFGAAATAVALEALLHRLRRAGHRPWLAAVLVAGLALTPALLLAATTDLASLLSLTFLVLALDGFSRFVGRGETIGGFRAGLAVGMATLCSAGALVYAAGFALAAPLLSRTGFHGERAAGRATAAVLAFPTVAGLAGWTFLCWRFAGEPFAWLRAASSGAGWGPVVTSLAALGHALLLTPVYALVLALLGYRRRWRAAVVALLPVAAVALVAVLHQTVTAGPTTLLLGAVALAALPRRLRRVELVALVVAVAGGLVLSWSPWNGVVGAGVDALTR